jgi:hypothetical protein
MLTQLKAYLLAAALTLTASSLAAPIFYVGDTAESVIVAFNESETATVTIDADTLLDARDQIRVSYGVTNLDSLLRVKQIITPEGITVSLKDTGITSETTSYGYHGANALLLEFEVSNSDYSSGRFPVQVILENVESGATFTVNLFVVAQ